MEGLLDLPLWCDPIPQLISALRRLEAEPDCERMVQVPLRIVRREIAKRKANPQPGDDWLQQATEGSDQPANVSIVLEKISTRRISANFLERTLQKAAQEIFDVSRQYDAMPKRSDLREKLEGIRISAEQILQTMRHEDIINADLDLEHVVQFKEGLDFSGALSRLSREISEILKRIEDGPGTQNSAPSFHVANPRLLCAHIVIEAWERVRGRRPNPKTGPAQEACAALWQAAGQQTSDAVEQGAVANGSSWQRHLASARKGDPPRKKGRLKRGETTNPRNARHFVCRVHVDRIFSEMGTE
jgi:hypothetical protein